MRLCVYIWGKEVSFASVKLDTMWGRYLESAESPGWLARLRGRFEYGAERFAAADGTERLRP